MRTVLDGMRRFADSFEGELVTETMLIDGKNDGARTIDATAAFVDELRPRVAYLAVPTRPPAESSVRPPRAEVLNRAFHRFADRLPRVELLTGFEGTEFATTGDVAEDVLGITAVHPLREDAMEALLARASADASLPDQLIRDGRLERVEYRGHRFYLRRLRAGWTR
jgi:wyosine [tRNA(Phe)-imidazoG37] synthetase (radical SAM superfamily)